MTTMTDRRTDGRRLNCTKSSTVTYVQSAKNRSSCQLWERINWCDIVQFKRLKVRVTVRVNVAQLYVDGRTICRHWAADILF